MNAKAVYNQYNNFKVVNGGSLTSTQKVQFKIDIDIARGIDQCGSFAAYQARNIALAHIAAQQRADEIKKMSGPSPYTQFWTDWKICDNN